MWKSFVMTLSTFLAVGGSWGTLELKIQAETFIFDIQTLSSDTPTKDVEIRAYFDDKPEAMGRSLSELSDVNFRTPVEFLDKGRKVQFQIVDGPRNRGDAVTGTVTIDENSLSLAKRQSIVFVFKRKGEPPTAVLPFITFSEKGDETHKLSIVVPKSKIEREHRRDGFPPCCPHQCRQHVCRHHCR